MKLDDAKKLHQKKYREAFGAFLLEGEHLILELQKAAQQQPQLLKTHVFATEQYANFQHDFPTTVVSEKHMAQLSDTKTPQGIIAAVPLLTGAPTPLKNNERAVYLHEIQDPGNLGTILRSLAWFGGCRCLLSPGSVDPFNPKVVRASMGAIFHVTIEQEVALESLPARFDAIVSLDMQGEPIYSEGFKTSRCLVFGNEARGVPRDALAALHATPFTIPGSGKIESLNLASAVNMSLYELARP